MQKSTKLWSQNILFYFLYSNYKQKTKISGMLLLHLSYFICFGFFLNLFLNIKLNAMISILLIIYLLYTIDTSKKPKQFSTCCLHTIYSSLYYIIRRDSTYFFLKQTLKLTTYTFVTLLFFVRYFIEILWKQKSSKIKEINTSVSFFISTNDDDGVDAVVVVFVVVALTWIY